MLPFQVTVTTFANRPSQFLPSPSLSASTYGLCPEGLVCGSASNKLVVVPRGTNLSATTLVSRTRFLSLSPIGQRRSPFHPVRSLHENCPRMHILSLAAHETWRDP